MEQNRFVTDLAVQLVVLHITIVFANMKMADAQQDLRENALGLYAQLVQLDVQPVQVKLYAPVAKLDMGNTNLDARSALLLDVPPVVHHIRHVKSVHPGTY